MSKKLINGKFYSRIPHLIGSRTGTGDRTVNQGQHDICTKRFPHKYIRPEVIVQEKVDGSCVGIYKEEGVIFPIIRAGYAAFNSHRPFLQKYSEWVYDNFDRFDSILEDGDWLMGEWLLIAHGTLIALKHEPFVAFDYFSKGIQQPYDTFLDKIDSASLTTPHLIHRGDPISIEKVVNILGEHGFHGSTEAPEGAVWRVEEGGRIKFLAKYVLPGKIDGKYLGKEEIYNPWDKNAQKTC